MSFEPLLNSSPIVQIHAFVAIFALLIGASQLTLPKGTKRHRAIGYIWTAFMIIVAASSLFINQIRMFGPFSLIHIFSLNVLLMTPLAMRRASQGNFKAHGRTMKITFWSALVIAGIFTLMPGRIMHQVIFGS